MRLNLKIEPVRHLLESQEDTATIQAAYLKATGEEITVRRVREWRAYVGKPLPRGLRHDLAAAPDTDVGHIQALVKKYWIPTDGNQFLC